MPMAKLMLRQCEEVLALHLTVHEKLVRRISLNGIRPRLYPPIAHAAISSS
jgi:hypothetical protein